MKNSITRFIVCGVLCLIASGAFAAELSASDILKGITRKKVLSLFPEIRVEDIETGRLYEFDEIFMTSTSRDVSPVVAVEGKKIGKGVPGPITRKIQAAFRARGW